MISGLKWPVGRPRIADFDGAQADITELSRIPDEGPRNPIAPIFTELPLRIHFGEVTAHYMITYKIDPVAVWRIAIHLGIMRKPD